MPPENFNSHARVGRDPWGLHKYCAYVHFNSHARVGRDRETNGEIIRANDFNSHARVGRDPRLDMWEELTEEISTHTPV